MQVVDTNVLVRLLTADDSDQHQRARDLFNEEEQVLLRVTVMLETAWVLLAVYEMPVDDVIAALTALTELENVRLEDSDRTRRAMELAAAGIDIADAFHIAGMPEGAVFATFDRRLAREGRRADLPIRLV